MNIQIFGTKKCNDTRKAERFFKERGIKYQFIDMKEKGMSKGEFNSVAQANGGLDNMVNWDGKDKDMVKKIMRDSLAGVLNALNADVLICGGIGGDAKTALAAAGIKLFGGVSGDADQAVKNCECCIDLYMD